MSFRDQWFDKVSTDSLYEAEFEKIIKQNIALIQPKAVGLKFKKVIQSTNGRNIPDLALIENDYSSWAIIEVELIHHDLYHHVIPQVRTFVDGRYPKDLATYLQEKDSSLDLEKLQTMIKGAPPTVVVVCNGHDATWQTELDRIGVRLISFEIYRSPEQTSSIFVVNGNQIFEGTKSLSLLSEVTLPRLLQVASPATLKWQVGERFDAIFDGQVLTWERLDTADKVFIRPLRSIPIQSGKSFELIEFATGQYEIRSAQ
jgi:hypothetical protein